MRFTKNIHTPADLKELSIQELDHVAQSLRQEIIEVVNRNGGHLASPLGVVELTIALHYVFDVGRDQLIWDVGHQCYAHKLLTGRRELFHTIRKKDGISGYPKISESDYDCFGTGHSSTSISAAAGMAAARDLQGEDYNVIAVIGDGAMTAGMAMEALSHAGDLGLNMLVILNDNEMSISKNVGALSRYFNRIITAGPYKRAKEDVGSFVKQLIGDRMTQTIQHIEKSVKGFITPGSLFQELGFNYIGPVDGHDLPLLVECLSNLKNMKGPILFHCRTEKGKGLPVAEEDPLKYHGISPMAVKKIDEEGDPLPTKEEKKLPPAKTFTDAFVEGMLQAGREDRRVVGITAAMPTGTGLSRFEQEFPDRFFDVGIAEQHAVTFAAGLAIRGMKPVAAIYSTFLQRGYDQVIHDVCIQNLPVVFAIDRAGLVGEDSPTQNGTFDLSFLRAVPNLKIIAPRDDVDTVLALRWALQQDGPVALRYARGKAPTIGRAEGRDIARGEILRDGSDANFLVVGPCALACLDAADRLREECGLSVGVADARHVKPLDAHLLNYLADRPIITVEENTLDGGFGAAVLEYFTDTAQLGRIRVQRIGIPDVFTEQMTRDEQLEFHGLDAKGLYAAARAFLAQGATVAVK
jgi:1-deoxy-D-xylulose-5-phosphate synthase